MECLESKTEMIAQHLAITVVLKVYLNKLFLSDD